MKELRKTMKKLWKFYKGNCESRGEWVITKIYSCNITKFNINLLVPMFTFISIFEIKKEHCLLGATKLQN